MTALAQRRAHRTITAATVALGLAIVAAVLVTVGVVTLSNSQEGEAVGVDTRPIETFPSTPNALLAVTDDEGQLASVVVMTLLPEGQGGSIVTVPVNADSTSGFGLQRWPLNEVFDPADPEGFVATVEDMLSITIEQSVVVDPAALEALLAPIESVSVVLPDVVVDSDADGSGSAPVTPTDSEGAGDEVVDGMVFTAGPQVLSPAEIADVLTAIDESVPAYEQHPIDVAMWTAVAQIAPVETPPEPVVTDSLGGPVPPNSIDQLLVQLFQGEIGVRDVAVVAPGAVPNPTDADVVVLDRPDVVLVFAQISPSLVSTPNLGLKMRVVAPYTDEQLAQSRGLFGSSSDLARGFIEQMLAIENNIVSVDTAPVGARDVTVVEVADPRQIADIERAAEALFGQAEVRVADTVIEGVDVVVTLGMTYIIREMVRADLGALGDAGTPNATDTTAPDGTVESDG